MTLDQLEQEYQFKLSQVTLVAEINITVEQWELLAQELRELVARRKELFGSEKKALSILEKHPNCVLVFLVAQGIFSYRSGDFWTGVATRLGLETKAHCQSVLGEIADNQFKKLDLPVLDKELGALRFVAPILFHGGIPRDYLPDFFSSFLKGNTSGFIDPGSLIEEWLLLTATMPVLKPVRRFLEYGGYLARNFVARCIETHRYFLQHRRLPLPEEAGLPQWILDAYREWNTKSPAVTTGNTPHLIFRRPEFELDPWEPQIWVILPEQQMPFDQRPVLEWKMIADENPSLICVPSCQSGETGYHSQLITERIESPAREYRIHLNFNGLSKSWTIPGISATQPFLVFDGATRRLIRWEHELPASPVWIVYQENQECVSQKGYCLEKGSQFWDGWQGFQVECWDLTAARQIKIGHTSFGVGRKPVPQFIEGTLARYQPRATEPPFYVGTPPALFIPINSKAEVDQFLQPSMLRIGRGNRPGTFIQTIQFQYVYDEVLRGVKIDLTSNKPHGLAHNEFGEIEVSFRGKSLKQDFLGVFAFISQLNISGNDFCQLPNTDGSYASRTIQLDIDPQVTCTLEIAGTRLIPEKRKDGQITFEVAEPGGELVLRRGYQFGVSQIQFRVPCPQLYWKLTSNGIELSRNRQFCQSALWFEQQIDLKIEVGVTASIQSFEVWLHLIDETDQVVIQELRGKGPTQGGIQFHLSEAYDTVRAHVSSQMCFRLVLNPDFVIGEGDSHQISVLTLSRPELVEVVADPEPWAEIVENLISVEIQPPSLTTNLLEPVAEEKIPSKDPILEIKEWCELCRDGKWKQAERSVLMSRARTSYLLDGARQYHLGLRKKAEGKRQLSLDYLRNAEANFDATAQHESDAFILGLAKIYQVLVYYRHSPQEIVPHVQSLSSILPLELKSVIHGLKELIHCDVVEEIPADGLSLADIALHPMDIVF